jgi:hypothetical protein
MRTLPSPSSITPAFSALLALVLLAIGLALGEARGWPMLVSPLQNALSKRLGRSVQLFPSGTDKASAASDARLHFLGGLAFETSWLQVAAPDWSRAPYVLSARKVALRLRYGDVWRAWNGWSWAPPRCSTATPNAALRYKAMPP